MGKNGSITVGADNASDEGTEEYQERKKTKALQVPRKAEGKK